MKLGAAARSRRCSYASLLTILVDHRIPPLTCQHGLSCCSHQRNQPYAFLHYLFFAATNNFANVQIQSPSCELQSRITSCSSEFIDFAMAAPAAKRDSHVCDPESLQRRRGHP